MKNNYRTLFLAELKSHKDENKAKHSMGFFKTDKGQYGYGDKFWGLIVPLQRQIAKKFYAQLTLKDIGVLLKNPVHEVRLSTLIALIEKYKRAEDKEKSAIVNLYLSNADRINNWDLVDLSAPNISGEFWFENSTKTMFEFAKSGHLWRERIAVVSNLYFIKRGRFEEILKLCERFLDHKHDLIHKATGWMLREVGKKNKRVLRDFLDKNAKRMPRTMLRYSIERLSDSEKNKYMEK
jgi:3-methyladenine DNA glycosylase AlkD